MVGCTIEYNFDTGGRRSHPVSHQQSMLVYFNHGHDYHNFKQADFVPTHNQILTIEVAVLTISHINLTKFSDLAFLWSF